MKQSSRIAAALAAVVLLALPLSAQESAPAQQQSTPPQQSMPAQLWDALLLGNKEFAGGKLVYDQLNKEREETRDHQNPPVTVLSCSDSRVPPELVFNQSIGTLFVIRTAGNVADDFGIASIEFAVTSGYTNLIVVLGHESCGAVKASLSADDPGTPSLQKLAQRIRTSFVGITWDPNDKEMLRKAVEANARASATQLLATSRVIRDAVMTEKLKIVPAYYDFGTGVVRKVE